MGIPSYFAHLVKKNPNLIKKIIETGCNRLFLDLNGVIHSSTQQTVKEMKAKLELQAQQKQMTPNTVENLINTNKTVLFAKILEKSFLSVIDYIRFLCSVIKPTTLLYIAIDGVAPMSKIHQQRQRRFRAHKDKITKRPIYSKFGVVNIDELLWDSNIITPGTPFMLELSDYIKKNLRNHLMDVLSPSVSIIFSDSLVKGEGEHKIMEHIRKTKDERQWCDVIYGLDADLIMLAMSVSSVHSGYRIYLLRETLEYGTHVVTDDRDMPVLCYFDIYHLKKELITDIKDKGIDVDDEQRWIVDYIFLCFLMGNDFLPHQHTLHISNGGIEILMNIYVLLYKQTKTHIIDENQQMCIELLTNIFDDLYKIENEEMYSHLQKMVHFKYRENRNDTQKTILEKELAESQQIKDRTCERNMLEHFEDWIHIYYEELVGITDKEEFEDMLQNYIYGMKWCLKYYLCGCEDYMWYYKYPATPTFENLRSYLREKGNCLQQNSEITRQHSQNIINMYEQQLMVLPSSSHKYIHPCLRERIENNLDMLLYFPEDFRLLTFGKRFNWESYPIIPHVDYGVYKKFVNECLLEMNTSDREIITINHMDVCL